MSELRILAIETSSRTGSLALLHGPTTVLDRPLPGDQRTASSLAPAMDQSLTEIGWAADAVDLVCVSVGPGSFTGLRVGVTTAKMFAYAAKAEIVGVNTLEVIAGNAPQDRNVICPVIDAQRKQLFVGRLERFEENRLTFQQPTQIMSRPQWLEQLRPGDFVLGPATKLLCDQLHALDQVEVADETLWEARATQVGLLGLQRYQQGVRDDLWSLTPEYYRLSAAEEKKAKLQPDHS